MQPLIRNYLSGDETALVALWNLAYATYAGYVPRSLEYWRWCITGRPGVAPEDVIIFQNTAEILGYTVLGPDGIALELAVDPRLSSWEREKVASHLIRKLEERSKIKGHEIIQFNVPLTDEPVCRALRRANYYDQEGSPVNMVIVDIAGLITRILCHREARIPKKWSPTFVFKIKPGYYRFCPYSQLSIQMGPPVIVKTDSEISSANCVVDVDLSTLADLIFRRTTFEEVMTTGTLAVHSVSDLEDVRTLLSLLTLESPWYTPPADER